MKKWLIPALLLFWLMLGAECEQQRLNGLDVCMMQSTNGKDISPVAIPFAVLIDVDMHHASAVLEAIERLNRFFLPHEVYVGSIIPPDDFLQLSVEPIEKRRGQVFVSDGLVGSIDADLRITDAGGVAAAFLYDDDRIITASITISSDIVYHKPTVLSGAIHELGHVLGLDHDGQSVDLNSCMSPSPSAGCIITPKDVQCVLDSI